MKPSFMSNDVEDYYVITDKQGRLHSVDEAEGTDIWLSAKASVLDAKRHRKDKLDSEVKRLRAIFPNGEFTIYQVKATFVFTETNLVEEMEKAAALAKLTPRERDLLNLE